MKNIPIRKINSPQNESNLSGSFDIRNVSDLLDGKDMVQKLHRHDFFYILALEKGAGNHEIDFTPYKILNHSIFFMRPGQVHQLALKAGSTGYLVEFKADFWYPHNKVSSQLLRSVSTKNIYQLNAASFKKSSTILTNIFQEYTDKPEGHHEVIKASMSILFIELARTEPKSKSRSNRVNPYAQERLEQFSELLEKDIASQKQVSHYADRLNLSAYQLNAITKTMVGKTASELMNDYIILESKRYLLSTANQINQIAYHLGYEDVSYFIRFFKKHTGFTPEAFRQNFG